MYTFSLGHTSLLRLSENLTRVTDFFLVQALTATAYSVHARDNCQFPSLVQQLTEHVL